MNVRILLTVVFALAACAPVRAQEPAGGAADRPADETAAGPAEGAPESPADLAGRMQALVADLQSPDAAVRTAALRRLAELTTGSRDGESLWGPVVGAGGVVLPGRVTVRLMPSGGGETIKGSWAEDGDRGLWQLEVLGEGRYRLRAEIAAEDGTATRVEDEGTLAELIRRHSFLEGTAFLAMTDAGGRLAPTSPRERRTPPASPVVRLDTLGLSLREACDDLRHQFWLPVGVGWVVASVEPGSPAARAGLKEHDLIAKADGAWLESPDALGSGGVALAVHRRGKPVAVDLPRVAREPDGR